MGLALTRLNSEHRAPAAKPGLRAGAVGAFGEAQHQHPAPPSPPYPLRTFACGGPPVTSPVPSLIFSSLLVKVIAFAGVIMKETTP